jgi:hypothetical protein
MRPSPYSSFDPIFVSEIKQKARRRFTWLFILELKKSLLNSQALASMIGVTAHTFVRLCTCDQLNNIVNKTS